jgi:hypothetical protein
LEYLFSEAKNFNKGLLFLEKEENFANQGKLDCGAGRIKGRSKLF